MNSHDQKIKAVELLQSQDPQKIFPALCLLMELMEVNPECFTPLEAALIRSVGTRIIKEVEKSLYVPDFDDDEDLPA